MIRTATALPHETVDVGIAWNGKNGNFDKNRTGATMIIMHSMDGYTKGSGEWFKTHNQSANYGVSEDGTITLWIPEDCVAYQAGKYSINQTSIGIEHEDQGNNQAPRDPRELESSAQLLADICTFYNIPLDRDHIKKHNEIVATACPGNLPVDDIITRAKAIIAARTQSNVAGDPDGKPPVTLTETLFEKLVSKSSSIDEVGRFLGYPQDQIDSPGFGKKAVEVLTSWQARLNAIAPVPQEGMPIASATTAQATPSVSTDPSQVPFDPFLPEGLPQQSKSIWTTDVLQVFSKLIASLKGNK